MGWTLRAGRLGEGRCRSAGAAEAGGAGGPGGEGFGVSAQGGLPAIRGCVEMKRVGGGAWYDAPRDLREVPERPC